MEKEEAKRLIKICRLIGHGFIKWKVGGHSVFPHNKLNVSDLMFYSNFPDYYLDYALTFYPDKSKADVRNVHASTAYGTEFYFKDVMKGGR